MKLLHVTVVVSLCWSGVGCHSNPPAPVRPPADSQQAITEHAARTARIEEANRRSESEVLARLGDRKALPAESVFKNVQIPWLKTVPAETFLSIMSEGYARALGVQCSHCHVPTDLPSDEKRPKRAAREMAQMHWNLNHALYKMENLRTQPVERRAINCMTCHRGRVDPHDRSP